MKWGYSYHVNLLTSSELASASRILNFSGSETREQYMLKRKSQPVLVFAPAVNMIFITSADRLKRETRVQSKTSHSKGLAMNSMLDNFSQFQFTKPLKYLVNSDQCCIRLEVI